MNQILVSEKLYVTPDMKKKKRMFKIEFFLSVFLLCALSSYAIYAEYDRNKSEEVSKEILQGIEFKENTRVVEEEVKVVILNAIPKENYEEEEEQDLGSEATVTELLFLLLF